MLYWKMIMAVITGETLIKHYIVESEKEGKKIWKLPGGVEIRRLENGGAATGVLSAYKKQIKICSGVVLAVCGLFMLNESRRRPVSVRETGFALLFGGGLCNFVDRMKKGTVTDYLRFTKCPISFIRNLVFNISDVCILIGGLLICVGRKFRIKS